MFFNVTVKLGNAIKELEILYYVDTNIALLRANIFNK